MTWHEDLVLSSFYQAEWSTATLVDTGVQWCSPYLMTLVVAGTAQTATASKGLNGHSKCSWQFAAADGNTGPAIKLKTSDFFNYLLFWTEFINATGLGTSGELTGSLTGDYHIGSYPSSDLTVYLNPVKTLAAAGS